MFAFKVSGNPPSGLALDMRVLAVSACLLLTACESEDDKKAEQESNKKQDTQVSAAASLNDTGITLCADENKNELPCAITTHPGQDAERGLDVEQNYDGDGKAGFSFTKVDLDGTLLPPSATAWKCVLDNVTNLMWEVKTPLFTKDDDVPSEINRQSNTNTYTWYEPNKPSVGNHQGYVGDADGSSCLGKLNGCDTKSYVSKLNEVKLCGYSDWRLPTRDELRSIVDYGVKQPGPTIDQKFFPNTIDTNNRTRSHSIWYWTSETYAPVKGKAWAVNFNYGGDGTDFKYGTKYIRLVRGAGQ